jgi:hypothetical protein
VSARSRRAPRRGWSIGWAVLGALGCAGYGDAVARGQRYYEDNQYERALALWRDLDRREATFDAGERTRYAYFRGMTDYRLGYREEARHWLAIAKARDATGSGGLGSAWRERLEGALGDLERETFGIHSDGADVVQTIELLSDAPASDASSSDAGAGPTDAPKGHEPR